MDKLNWYNCQTFLKKCDNGKGLVYSRVPQVPLWIVFGNFCFQFNIEKHQ